MRGRLLIPALLLLVACGGDDVDAAPEPLAEYTPEIPTPPPVEGDLLSSIPQEPLPEGVEPATPAEPETPPPAEPVAPADPATLGELVLVEAAVAREVVDRRPAGESPFGDGTEVSCYIRVDNPGGRIRTVRHVWYFGDVRKSSIPLKIKGTTWRTWSTRPVYGVGAWRVDIVDEADRVLKSLPFVVE